MNKLILIIKHEFIQAIKKSGYIITTLLIPVGVLLSLGVSELVDVLTESKTKEALVIGYIDEVGIISAPLEEGLISLLPYQSTSEAKQDLVDGEISEYIVIPEAFFSDGRVERFTQDKELFPPLATSQTIKSFLTLNLIRDKVPSEVIKSIVSPLNLEVTRLDQNGGISENQGNIGNIIIPAVYAFLLTMTFQYGTTALISGLGEEKESRLIEVLYSSVSVRELMVGKIVALGAAGLLQVLIWLSSAPLLLNLGSSSIGGFLNEIYIPANFIILGVVYYLLGYLLFATMSVTLGGITSTVSEAHNLSMIYSLTCYVPIWFIGLFINYPESPAWVVLSIFPITAPIQTMIRLGVSEVPTWQLGVSLGVLSLSVLSGILLAEKVFRTFMLMYGKRLTVKEILQGLRNS
jgi:ABC-2 type transport system permease protein